MRSNACGFVARWRLESFFSVAQMALAGFGHGLVPIGVARTLKVPEEEDAEPGGTRTDPARAVRGAQIDLLPADRDAFLPITGPGLSARP